MAISLLYNSNISYLDYYTSLQLIDLFISSPLQHILQTAAKMIFLKCVSAYDILEVLQSLPITVN